MRMPPLLADFIYNRVCELKCEKFLTRPSKMAKAIFSAMLMNKIWAENSNRQTQGSRRATASAVALLLPWV